MFSPAKTLISALSLGVKNSKTLIAKSHKCKAFFCVNKLNSGKFVRLLLNKSLHQSRIFIFFVVFRLFYLLIGMLRAG